MSFLNLRKKSTAPEKVVAKPAVIKKIAVSSGSHADISKNIRFDILHRPHITEKASAGAEKGVYVFDVAKSATKREIAKAVAALYKVTPVKVAIVAIPRKQIIVKGRSGMSGGGKKAYVYLKKGEKIEIV